MRRVRERDVKAPSPCEATKRWEPSRHRPSLSPGACAAVPRPDDLVLDAVQPEKLDGLRVIAGGHVHRVPARLQQSDQRAKERHLGGVGDVDPDAHRQTLDTPQASLFRSRSTASSCRCDVAPCDFHSRGDCGRRRACHRRHPLGVEQGAERDKRGPRLLRSEGSCSLSRCRRGCAFSRDPKPLTSTRRLPYFSVRSRATSDPLEFRPRDPAGSFVLLLPCAPLRRVAEQV